MPPDISTTPRPLIPTGSPPCPAIPSVNTNTSSESTSMNTVVSGQDRLTFSPCASWISRPTSTASSAEVSGKRLSRRRAGTGGILGQRDRGGADRLGRLGHSQRHADPGDPGHLLHPLRDPGRGLRPARRAEPLAIGDAQQDDPLALADVGPHAEVAHRGADVGVENALELLPVLPLEHDLAQLEEHAQLIGTMRAQGIGERWHPPSLPGANVRPERIAGESVTLNPGASPSVFHAAPR